MNEVNFKYLNFYDKLRHMEYICGDVLRNLRKIINDSDYDAQEYIKEQLDLLETNFLVFSQDEELLKKENVRKSIFFSEITDALELIPLMKEEGGVFLV